MLRDLLRNAEQMAQRLQANRTHYQQVEDGIAGKFTALGEALMGVPAMNEGSPISWLHGGDTLDTAWRPDDLIPGDVDALDATIIGLTSWVCPLRTPPRSLG